MALSGNSYVTTQVMNPCDSCLKSLTVQLKGKTLPCSSYVSSQEKLYQPALTLEKYQELNFTALGTKNSVKLHCWFPEQVVQPPPPSWGHWEDTGGVGRMWEGRRERTSTAEVCACMESGGKEHICTADGM